MTVTPNDTPALLEVLLRIPSTRQASAAWISQQEPNIVAEALSLCEAAFSAVSREASSGECSRLLAAHHVTVTGLERQLIECREASREAAQEARKNAERTLSLIIKQQEDAISSQQKQLDASREHYEALLKKQREEHAKASVDFSTCLSNLEAQLDASRLSNHKAIEDALANEKKRFMAEQREFEEELRSEHKRLYEARAAEANSLIAELESRKGREATIREEIRETSERNLEHREKEWFMKVKALEDLLVEREGVWIKSEAWFKTELQRRDDSIREERQANRDYAQRFESLASRLTGTTVSGQVGENFVAKVFSKLQLGSWQDDHSVQAEGFADALWTFQPSPSCPVLSCLVEIKNVNTVNTTRDIGKWERDLNVAVQTGRANAGLFISLAARCPGIPPLHLTILHGVPVCYLSRDGEDDVLPASCAVELAFRALSESWPLICRQRGEGVQLTISAVADFLDEQLKDIERLSKHIAGVSRAATSLKREVQSLEKIRDGLINGVNRLRLSHPSLVPEVRDDADSTAPDVEKTEEDPWTSAGAEELLSVIRKWKDAKKRYPKSIEDIEVSDCARTFTSTTPNAFLLAVAMLKKGRKRNATQAELLPDSAEPEDINED